MYEYVCMVAAVAAARFCYWAPTQWRQREKKYSTRMHTYEQTREREKKRERETSLFDNCCIIASILHQPLCYGRASTEKKTRENGQGLNRSWINQSNRESFS